MRFHYCRASLRGCRYAVPGMTRVETIALIAALGLALVIVVVTMFVARPLSRELTCAANLSSLGKACKIYTSGAEVALAPPISVEPRKPWDSIKYTVPVGGGRGTRESPDRTQPADFGTNGAQKVSVTRLLWMYARSGDVQIKQFICPESADTPDPTEDIDTYYDFTAYEHVSYGYQVPFGRGAGGMPDSRMPLMADKGPYIDASVPSPPPSLTAALPPTAWTPYNSRNHRGQGQNVLFMDGHATFERTPLAGIEHDNIYTVALDAEHPESRVAGESPWVRSAYPFTVFDRTRAPVASTDTVIFP
jgi:prepilin-type processing-associated H-X9-DG protein